MLNSYMDQSVVAILMQCEPGAAVHASLERLLKEDSYLLQTDVNERSISHRLAMYLSQALANWDVDCEYNRDGDIPKALIGLQLKPTATDTDAETVYPDIIAHKRGADKNYLVIEIKKSTSRVSSKVDLEKLQGYKDQLGYTFALFIVVGTLEHAGAITAQWI